MQRSYSVKSVYEPRVRWTRGRAPVRVALLRGGCERGQAAVRRIDDQRGLALRLATLEPMLRRRLSAADLTERDARIGEIEVLVVLSLWRAACA